MGPALGLPLMATADSKDNDASSANSRKVTTSPDTALITPLLFRRIILATKSAISSTSTWSRRSSPSPNNTISLPSAASRRKRLGP